MVAANVRIQQIMHQYASRAVLQRQLTSITALSAVASLMLLHVMLYGYVVGGLYRIMYLFQLIFQLTTLNNNKKRELNTK